MRYQFLEALNQSLEIPYFINEDSRIDDFLKEFPEYQGMALRIYTGESDSPWKFFFCHPFSESKLLDLLGQPKDLDKIETWENLLEINHENKTYNFIIAPYLNETSHMGDLFVIVSENDHLYEWHALADRLAKNIFSKYLFPERLTRSFRKESERILSFIRKVQLILNTNRNVSALPPGQEKRQAEIWKLEDEPYIFRFLRKFQLDFDLHTVFIIQNAAPSYKNIFVLSAVGENNDLPEEFIEMIEAPINHDLSSKELQLTKTIMKFSPVLSSEKLDPLIFACQAGGNTFGHLGFFSKPNHILQHIHHQAKLLPMLANQLGFYFGHFYHLRKEAIHGRMLQQINQTCNTINSSVDIGAIVFKLIESLNYLFGQFSGAILIYSRDNSDLEVVNYLGGTIPEGLDVSKLASESGPVLEAINEGAAFDNRDGAYPLPVRYVLPLASTPQATILGPDFLSQRALGGVILFESELNRDLSQEDLDKLIPILLNGISASLQVACNYAEKLDTIKALEGLMDRLSDKDALLDEMIIIIRRLLKVNRISFLTVSPDGKYLEITKGHGLPPGIINSTKIPMGEEISGYVAQQGKSYRIDNIELEGTFKKRSMEDYLNRSLLSVPLMSTSKDMGKQVIGVINVNNKTNGLTFTAQDQQLLEAIAHLVVTALDNIRLLEKEYEKQLLDRQLQDAKDIQMSLLPKRFNEVSEKIEMFGKSIPARQIGGDFFDILSLDDGRVLIALGDVSGKGMPAAILMAVSRMILRSAVQQSSDILEILDIVNLNLSKELDAYHFVTLQIVAIDTLTGECTMSSAGHGPLMARLNKNITMIETKSGPPLGIAPVAGIYDKSKFKMVPNDTVLLFTDGLSEEHSPTGEMFGNDRIINLLDSYSDKSSQELVEKLFSSAMKWRGTKEAHDDLTVFTLKFKG